MGFHLEWKTLYAKKPQNDVTNNQTILKNSTLLQMTGFFFQSLFIVNFHKNLSCMKNLIHI